MNTKKPVYPYIPNSVPDVKAGMQRDPLRRNRSAPLGCMRGCFAIRYASPLRGACEDAKRSTPLRFGDAARSSTLRGCFANAYE